MTIISFICLLIFLAFLITGLKRNQDFLSPGRIFGMLWALVIGLADFKFSHYQLDWSLYQWFILLLGLFTFLAGVYVSYIINFDKPFLTVNQIRVKIREHAINEKFLFNLIVFLFLLYVLSYLVEWQIEGYIPLFTPQPDKARKLFGVFGIHLIVQGVNVILFLIIQYFIFINSNFKKKFLLTLVLLVSTGSFLLLLQRYNFVILILMGFCLLYYSGRKIKFRTYLISFIIITSVIVGIQTLRSTDLLTSYFYVFSKMKFSSQYAEWTIPYMYIVMNVETFVKYFPQIDNHTFGFFTFDFLTAISGLKHWITEYFNLEKFQDIGGYNTYPFYWAYYYDFGIIGLSLIPFLLGFIFSEIYYLLHRNPNLVILSLYTIAFAVIGVSYTSDPLTRLDMMFNFVIIVIAQFIIVKKQILPNQD